MDSKAQFLLPVASRPFDGELFYHEVGNALKAHKRFFNRLKRDIARRSSAHQAATAFASVHVEVFKRTDCLACANCCRTTSPRLVPRDVDRLARALRMRPAALSQRFLRTDADGDVVMRSTPCPFLDEDNRCAVYEHRPKACREYPHTDRKQSVSLLTLTQKNAAICPAVFTMVDKLSALAGDT